MLDNTANKVQRDPGFYYDRSLTGERAGRRSDTFFYLRLIDDSLHRTDRTFEEIRGLKDDTLPRISRIFNLISERVPDILDYFIGLSHHLSGDAEDSAPETLPAPDFESGLITLSRESGIDSFSLLKDLRLMLRSEEWLMYNLVKVEEEHVFKIIAESLSQAAGRRTHYFPLRREDLTRILSEQLMLSGCSQTLNLKLSGLHHKTVSQIYASNGRAPGGTGRRPRASQRQIMRDRGKNHFTMLALRFYTLAKQIRDHQAARVTLRPDLHATVDPALACGAFAAALFIYGHARNEDLTPTARNSHLPLFDDYYKLLEEYVLGSAVPVACSICHTPYLIFKHKAGDIYVDRLESHGLACPTCSRRAEYELED